MTTEHPLHLNLPPEVVDHLHIDAGDEVQLTVPASTDATITLQAAHAQPSEHMALPLRWFWLPTLLSSIAFYFYFNSQHQTQFALAGSNSIASTTIMFGLVSGSLSFIFFYFQQRRVIQKWLTGSLYWRTFPTVLLSFIIILTMCMLGFFWFAGLLFRGITFDQFTSTILFFLFSSLINFLMMLSAVSLSANMIYTLLISVIVGGVFSSMITNSNKRWWEHNLSFLGTDRAANSWSFNLTLIVSALITIALLDFIFSNLRKQFGNSRRLLALRLLLVLTTMCLGCVGLFANNGHGLMHILHDEAARWMVYFMIITILTIRFLLPRLTTEFKVFSYTIGGLLVATSLLFHPVQYLSLTAYEMIAFTMAFSWLLLLLQTLQHMVMADETTFVIKIE
ncbi:DUF998 domain-containing protein [Furfurilactobacillus entadae]|uniref:DUF998 domain-containing protein n=1 Tax=Furfurilactobacillus entadae TaxID=2922307 RepID=UPI0035F0082F